MAALCTISLKGVRVARIGDNVTLADCFLVPQMYNAHRFGVDVSEFPTLNGIVDACNSLPAFAAAIPEAQPDAN